MLCRQAIFDKMVPVSFTCTLLPRLRSHPEATSDQTKYNAHNVFPDPNYRVWELVRAHKSMIRGHFGRGWCDQRSLPESNGLIRAHFCLGWPDQRRIQAQTHIILIKDPFRAKIFILIFCFFYLELLALPRGNKKQHSDYRQI